MTDKQTKKDLKSGGSYLDEKVAQKREGYDDTHDNADFFKEGYR